MPTVKLVKGLQPLIPSLKLPNYATSIAFSSNGEDYRSEYSCLDFLNKYRVNGYNKNKVMTIVGGGDNIPSLLCRQDIDVIHGIDMNESQIRLCDLKINYALSLEQNDILRVLQSNFSGWLTNNNTCNSIHVDDNKYRKNVYNSHIFRNNNYVSNDSCTYWCNRIDNEISNGFIGLSNIDKLFLIFLNNIGKNAKLLMNKDIFNGHNVGETDLNMLHDIIGHGMQNDAVWNIIQASFPEKVWKSWIPFHQMVFKEYFRKHKYPQHSYFYSFMVDQSLNSIDENNYPLWLQKYYLNVLKNRGINDIAQCVKFHNGDFLDTAVKIVNKHGYKFDLINTSNIFDWQDPQYAKKAIKLLSNQCLSDGGLLITRFAVHGLITQETEERVKVIQDCVKNDVDVKDKIYIHQQMSEKVTNLERG
eukprot:48084_1